MPVKRTNAKAAGSGEPKPAKRRSTRPSTSRQRHPQPGPVVDVQLEKPAAESEPLGGLLNLFPSPKESQPPSVPASSASSGDLPPENRAAVDAVPDVIGAPAGADEPEGELSADDVRELMAQVAFEEQDIKDLLGELFDWLADRFESDHWKLSERQMRILGGPSFRLANVLWKRLEERLPDILIGWCESTPGAAAFIMACGIVVGPKIAKQLRLSKGPKPVKEPRVEDRPAPRRSAAPPAPGEPHIPVAVGWQGEGGLK